MWAYGFGLYQLTYITFSFLRFLALLRGHSRFGLRERLLNVDEKASAKRRCLLSSHNNTGCSKWCDYHWNSKYFCTLNHGTLFSSFMPCDNGIDSYSAHVHHYPSSDDPQYMLPIVQIWCQSSAKLVIQHRKNFCLKETNEQNWLDCM